MNFNFQFNFVPQVKRREEILAELEKQEKEVEEFEKMKRRKKG